MAIGVQGMDNHFFLLGDGGGNSGEGCREWLQGERAEIKLGKDPDMIAVYIFAGGMGPEIKWGSIAG